MTAPAPPAAGRARRTAGDRETRRRRILARFQEGCSYDRIAITEGLTRERVRQIVVESLQRREVDPSREHAILQSARLDGALRLAAEKVADGDLHAIYPLLRVLDRLDRYQGVAAALGTENSEDDRAMWDAAFADLVRRAKAVAACEADRGDRSAEGAGDEAEGDSQAFSPANH